MLFVTTCSRAGFEQYGHRLFESFDNAPAEARMVWYTEDYDLSPKDRITAVPCTKVHRLQAFKTKYASYDPVSWRWDVVKFANKVFTVCDALEEHDGIGIWIDADCVIHKPVDGGTLSQFLPDGAYMSLFSRAGMYTETGFWMMNCRHELHREFLETWLAWYETGEFRALKEWHDCMTLDATIKKLGVPTFSLSGEHEFDMHPMAKSPLAEWFDHCKGARKEKGVSPENAFRQ